jgi:N-acetylneuraminate synthase
MIQNKKVFAIILARGGSKGIPRKNIKLLAGKPLIAYTINEAKKSKYIDKIIVSTDDSEIAEVSKRYGSKIQIRPKELAQDNTPSLPALQYVVKTLEEQGENIDIVVLLQPTNPFRKTKTIDKVIEKINQGFNSCTTISPLEIHPCRFLEIKNNKAHFINKSKETLRQNINQYHVDGTVYAYKKDTLKELNILPWDEEDNAVIKIDSEEFLDIDELIDFEIAEFLINKSKTIKINNKIIGNNESCFIIAEAGVNHNKDLETAKKLADAAKWAGADAVKFQTFKSENLVTKQAFQADYQKNNIGKKESQFDMLKRLELPYEDFKELKKYCDEKNIIFMSTPHTPDAADFLEDLVPAYKIPSGDLINLPFLEKIAKKQKPIIFGTGMGTLDEVKEAITTIKSQGNNQIIALHCTTNYPCPLEEVNLRAMQTMQKELDCLVGYSDHTLGIEVSQMAKKLGAVVIEKHFTLDKNMPGPDHKASLEPYELKQMVRALKTQEYEKTELNKIVLGSPKKEPNPSEIRIAKVARKSIVSNKYISQGKKIEKEDLIIKRPGTGILPKKINEIIGKTAKQNIKKDELIKLEDINF